MFAQASHETTGNSRYTAFTPHSVGFSGKTAVFPFILSSNSMVDTKFMLQYIISNLNVNPENAGIQNNLKQSPTADCT